jgi:hypothetical protein
MARRVGLGRLTAALLFVAAVSMSGCVLVPVPAPVVGPPVIVAPRPIVVIPGRPVYGSYRPYGYYHRGYGWVQ